MRLEQVLTFIAGILSSLNLNEASDGFNLKNIPSYLLDKTFSIQYGQIQGQSANQQTHQFTIPLDINVFFKDYRNPNDLRHVALATAQDMLGRLLSAQVRLSSGLKDIRPRTITLQPLDKTNDNSAILVLSLDVILMFAF